MNEPRIVTYGEILQILEKKEKYKNKYRVKVSYGSENPEDDYIFSVAEAMRDSKK